MQYNYQDLGHLNSGAVVRVDLEGDEVNVRLLDQSNYRSFQAGRGCRGFGGHYKASPAVFTIPTYDHWYVVIDYGGGPGRGRAAVQVFNNYGIRLSVTKQQVQDLPPVDIEHPAG